MPVIPALKGEASWHIAVKTVSKENTDFGKE
jgi:hypothetical protein